MGQTRVRRRKGRAEGTKGSASLGTDRLATDPEIKGVTLGGRSLKVGLKGWKSHRGVVRIIELEAQERGKFDLPAAREISSLDFQPSPVGTFSFALSILRAFAASASLAFYISDRASLLLCPVEPL